MPGWSITTPSGEVITLGAAGTHIRWIDDAGLGQPPVQIRTRQSPTLGSVVESIRFGERRAVLVIGIIASTYAATQEAIAELSAKLAAVHSGGIGKLHRFTYTNYSNHVRYIDAIVTGGLQWPQPAKGTAFTASIEIVAPEPYFVSAQVNQTITAISMTESVGPAWPLEWPVEWGATGVIGERTLRSVGDAPVHNWQLECGVGFRMGDGTDAQAFHNLAITVGDAAIRIARVIAQGQAIQFQFTPEQVYAVLQPANVDISTELNADAEPLTLWPGTGNTGGTELNIAVGDGGSVGLRMEYSPTYVTAGS